MGSTLPVNYKGQDKSISNQLSCVWKNIVNFYNNLCNLITSGYVILIWHWIYKNQFNNSINEKKINATCVISKFGSHYSRCPSYFSVSRLRFFSVLFVSSISITTFLELSIQVWCKCPNMYISMQRMVCPICISVCACYPNHLS